jgi:PhnB protein
MANVKAIPSGYTTVTPSITVKDAPKVIEFYKKAFGATERARMPGPDGKIMHAEIQIGNSIIMMNDEVMGSRSAQTIGGSPVSFYVYVEDADAAFKKAIAAGAKEQYPLTDMFWGDRMGSVEDPFGLKWTIAQHIKDVSPEQMKKGQEEFMKQMAGAGSR